MGDIEYLKLKMEYYVLKEEYEKAEKLKKWIVELGGDPELKKKNVKNRETKD